MLVGHKLDMFHVERSRGIPTGAAGEAAACGGEGGGGAAAERAI